MLTHTKHSPSQELGWPGVGNAVGLGRMPIRNGACAAPVPGYDIRVVDDDGKELPSGELGNMIIKTPLPPGTLTTLYNNDQRYVDAYLTKYPGFYDTGDAAFIDDHGYIHIMGRTDDIINTAGHRLSTGAMEEILMDHPEVADCAVIPAKDVVKGQVPVGFVVVNKGSTIDPEQLKSELIQSVRDALGPVASFKKVAILRALPKTRSGKILRSTMAKIANGEAYTVTPTIEDPAIFEYLEPEIRKLLDSERTQPKYVQKISDSNGSEKPPIEEALGFVGLPRTVSTLNGLPIIAAIGPHGPYLKYDTKFLSLNRKDGDVLTIDAETAEELVTEGIINAKSKPARNAVVELGEKDGCMVTVKDGPYGSYINWKKVNMKLPAEYLGKPSEFPLEEAWSLVQEKAGQTAITNGSRRPK
jgi:hypothetical protein